MMNLCEQMLDFHPVIMASFTMTLARYCQQRFIKGLSPEIEMGYSRYWQYFLFTDSI